MRKVNILLTVKHRTRISSHMPTVMQKDVELNAVLVQHLVLGVFGT